jgi:Domain of unknown function (DUF4410)
MFGDSHSTRAQVRATGVKFVWLMVTTAIALALFTGLKAQGTAEEVNPRQEAQDSIGEAPKKVPVYVTNFELDVVRLPPGRRPSASAQNPSQPGLKPEPPDPAKQASYLVGTMATKLVGALQKAGYPAQRLQPGDGRPANGVQIRGIFAEVDNENHWRRAVIRTGEDKGKINAMVAVSNLARPDQALYEIAPLPGNTNKPGAVITLSPYLPLEKFELNKDSDENTFARIAFRVVADLNAFLSRNPEALPE